MEGYNKFTITAAHVVVGKGLGRRSELLLLSLLFTLQILAREAKYRRIKTRFKVTSPELKSTVILYQGHRLSRVSFQLSL